MLSTIFAEIKINLFGFAANLSAKIIYSTLIMQYALAVFEKLLTLCRSR